MIMKFTSVLSQAFCTAKSVRLALSSTETKRDVIAVEFKKRLSKSFPVTSRIAFADIFIFFFDLMMN